jgi:hypothetical protein
MFGVLSGLQFGREGIGVAAGLFLQGMPDHVIMCGQAG